MIIRKIKNDKRGFIGVVIFVIALLFIVMLGIIASIGAGLFDYAGDIVQPVFAELDNIEEINVNMSEVSSYTITPANTFVQALPWLVGFAYVVMLVSSIIFAVSYQTNPHPAFIGGYIFLVLLLVIGAIILSNVYEDIYTGSDELSTRLQEQTLLSYMILFSPTILGIIAILTGVFIFSRPSDTGGGL